MFKYPVVLFVMQALFLKQNIELLKEYTCYCTLPTQSKYAHLITKEKSSLDVYASVSPVYANRTKQEYDRKARKNTVKPRI